MESPPPPCGPDNFPPADRVNRPGIASQGSDAAIPAILGFTTALAREIGSTGATVNAITPGALDTNSRGHQHQRGQRRGAGGGRHQRRHPVGRNAITEEIAAVSTFLSSDESGDLAGNHLDINGGSHIPKRPQQRSTGTRLKAH